MSDEIEKKGNEPKPTVKTKTCPNPSCKKGKIVLRGPTAGTYRVRCEGCGLIGTKGKTPDAAIEAWNGLYRPGEPYGERCFLWHDWSKWEDDEIHKRTIRQQDGSPDIAKGEYLVQTRYCKRCGEKRYRSERIFDVDKDT